MYVEMEAKDPLLVSYKNSRFNFTSTVLKSIKKNNQINALFDNQTQIKEKG